LPQIDIEGVILQGNIDDEVYKQLHDDCCFILRIASIESICFQLAGPPPQDTPRQAEP